MFFKIKNTFFLVSFFIFVFFTTKHYLSDENIIFTNKSRSSYSLFINKHLPLLENDTNNIILYRKDPAGQFFALRPAKRGAPQDYCY